MGIKLRKKSLKLTFMEDQPRRYKVAKVTMPTIKEKELIEYIANSASVPRSTIQAAVEAIGQGIAYFVINGHRVQFDRLGAFYLKFSAKAMKTKAECDMSTIRRTAMGFQPLGDLRDVVDDTSVSMQTKLGN